MLATYLEYFRLRERPFSSAPDPRFVYLGAQHERALAHLLRGVRDEHGMVHLTGERGNGKTIMCRVLLQRLPEKVDVALVLNPVFSPTELLAAVCDELGVRYAKDGSGQAPGDALCRHLEARAGGRRTLLIVDDAHNLGLDVIEQLRRLASLEVDVQQRPRIILIGEPGLVEPLGRLSQPNVAGVHLLPLAEPETCAYVRHRLTIAGGAHDLFDVEALRDVHHLSGGVPRLINSICDRALLSAAAHQRRGVDRLTVRAAARAATAPAGSDTLETIEAAPRVEPVRGAPKRAAVPVPTRRPFWPWLVSGGFALNAAVVGAVFLVPRQTDVGTLVPAAITNAEAPTRVETAPVPQAPATDDPPSSTRQPAPVPPRAEPTPPSPVTPPRAQPVAPALSFAPAPYPPVAETPRQRRRRARDTSGSLGSATSPPVSSFAPGPSQPEAAPLKVDLLVWAADPRERLVYLNGRKYVEGQTLENGVLVETIAEDGVVLVQSGRRIRLPAETRAQPYIRP
jgi:type II secretory pathway predicted ATPase ExeA